MSIRNEARRQAERCWPLDRHVAFEAGAAWASEREPSDAEIEAAAFVIDEGAMDSPADYPLQAEAALQLARAALQAAREVRRG